MAKVLFDGIEVDRCTGCGGLWFDRLEEKKLKEKKGSEAIDTGDAKVGRTHNEQRDVRCPRCTVRMVRMVDAAQPHIWYESCAVCGGTYFDAGEFRDYKSVTLFDVVRDFFAGPRK